VNDSTSGRDATPSEPLEPRAAPLIGRRVYLRPVYPDDYRYLYSLATSERVGYRWRERGMTPSPEDFARALWDRVLAQFIIVTKSDDRPIGLVICSAANFRNGFAYISLVLDPSVWRSGWPLEGILLFLNYIFMNWNFRKLYLEAPEFTYKDFRSGEGRLFIEEGVLREHEYYDDRYWDMHVLAVPRSLWLEHGLRLLRPL